MPYKVLSGLLVQHAHFRFTGWQIFSGHGPTANHLRSFAITQGILENPILTEKQKDKLADNLKQQLVVFNLDPIRDIDVMARVEITNLKLKALFEKVSSQLIAQCVDIYNTIPDEVQDGIYLGSPSEPTNQLKLSWVLGVPFAEIPHLYLQIIVTDGTEIELFFYHRLEGLTVKSDRSYVFKDMDKCIEDALQAFLTKYNLTPDINWQNQFDKILSKVNTYMILNVGEEKIRKKNYNSHVQELHVNQQLFRMVIHATSDKLVSNIYMVRPFEGTTIGYGNVMHLLDMPEIERIFYFNHLHQILDRAIENSTPQGETT